MTQHVSHRRSNEVAQLNGEIRRHRKALFMAAANCQGGSSEAGAHVAAVLGVPFPLRMEALREAAIRDGFDPEKLWPWWDQLRAKAS